MKCDGCGNQVSRLKLKGRGKALCPTCVDRGDPNFLELPAMPSSDLTNMIAELDRQMRRGFLPEGPTIPIERGMFIPERRPDADRPK